uniref:BTB/POZ domain-containing protein At1g30440 n=1 Tax=Anthurium amnicola TaxID=1678845 RepID=A0A1D1YGK8_9ARAE
MKASATNSPDNFPLLGGGEPWLDESWLLDMDTFVKGLADAKARGIRPDHVASLISHYAPKWLPELSGNGVDAAAASAAAEGGPVAAWQRKRLFVEAVVGALPTERGDCRVPCGLLLRLLRVANMVGAEPACRAGLEARVARRLDQASLGELMVPAFSHTCGTLLDVGLVLRLVRGFAAREEAAPKSGAAVAKVARLVDGYLAEAALDANLGLPEFEALAGALPSHARATDDGLYRAVDTYLKAHPSTSKEERKALFRLLDIRKLSSEASFHATHNERIPVRAVMQVLFSEQTKLHRLADWSTSLSGPRSPAAMEVPARCPSKREVMVQNQEIRRLRDDVARLQLQCHSLQAQVDRLAHRKKRGFFKWRSLLFRQMDVVEKMRVDEVVAVAGKKPRASLHGKTSSTPKWRHSLS